MQEVHTLNLLRAGMMGETATGRWQRAITAVLWSSSGRRWIAWDIYIGWLAAWSAFNLTPYGRQPNGLLTGMFFGLLMGLASWVCGTPRPETNPSRYELLSVGLITVMLGMVLCMVSSMALAYLRIGRWIWALFVCLTYIGMITPRMLVTGMESAVRHRVLLYGAGGAGRAVLEHLRRHPGMQMLGFVDDDQSLWDRDIAGLPCWGGIGQLPAICRKLEIRMLALSIKAPLPDERIRDLLALRHTGIEIVSIPELYERFAGCIPVELVSAAWLLQSGHAPQAPAIRVLKRMLDLCLSGLGLAVSMPLWGLIALAIKLDGRGPVFFRQWRMGQGNRPFRIIKFRSMFTDAEAGGARWTQAGDQRVTRLGYWLRLTRLDELPQLVNVLRNEMSLVGPRPERPEFIAEIEKVIPYYDQRGLVKPGLTGWAQVKYRYGANLHDARRKLEYDLYYIRNMSFRLDLQILLRTIVLLMKGSR